jgi:hypothetical protein
MILWAGPSAMIESVPGVTRSHYRDSQAQADQSCMHRQPPAAEYGTGTQTKTTLMAQLARSSCNQTTKQ